MWHRLSFVAESLCVSAAELTAFALANLEKYGIVVDRGSAEVSTWHVDALVRDFKAFWPQAVRSN